MKYPENITTKKAKLFYWISHHEYRFNQGRGLIGKVTTLLPESGWFIAGYIYLTNDKPTVGELTVAAVIISALLYLLGTMWMKWNGDRVQVQFQSERDPMRKSVYDKIMKGKGEKL